jgi:hypothetical protein
VSYLTLQGHEDSWAREGYLCNIELGLMEDRGAEVMTCSLGNKGYKYHSRNLIVGQNF